MSRPRPDLSSYAAKKVIKNKTGVGEACFILYSPNVILLTLRSKVIRNVRQVLSKRRVTWTAQGVCET
jgi:hypothetical protein